MGCVPSTPQVAEPAPKPAAKPVANAVAAAAYETELAASLTDGGTQSVAYHGLLNQKNAIRLVRSPHSPLHKLVHRSIHPSDSLVEPRHHDHHLSVVHGVAMTMPYTIIVSKPNVHDHVSQLVTPVFEQYDAILNAWNQSSEISAINSLAPGKNAPLSAELQHLFSIVDNVFDITQARFDPTTAVLNIAFENCIRDNNRPPLPTELQPYKHAIGWNRRVKRGQNSVSRTNANTIIDLDGISKGFVIDCITQRLLENGYTDVYVDWAADIRAVGNHPSGRPWRAALIQPPQLKRLFNHWREKTLPNMLTADDISHLASFHVEGVQDVSLATSGDYFSVQKYGYHHIARGADLCVMKANPKSVASVCIAASTCAVADAVATAAMTFESVSNAVQFCTALCEQYPHKIYGYCVMGRDGDMSFSSSIFEPVATKAEPSQELDDVNQDVSRVSSAVLQKLLSIIFVGHALVVRAGQLENVHSLVSLSLSPEQLVSFHTTKSFAADDDRACECFVMFDKPPVGTESGGISMTLSIKEVYNVDDDGAIVVARIEKVRLGTVDSLKVVYGDTVLARKNLKLSCVRSKFELAPLVDQCKDVFRNYASMIWVVTSTSVEHKLFALTGTSVTITEGMKDIVCFNILHTSTFYASFGGVGSEVRLYALSRRMQDLASKYTGQSNVEDSDAKRLGLECLAAVEGSVVMVKDVQDHHIVVVRMSNVSFNDDAGTPLVWLQGGFV